MIAGLAILLLLLALYWTWQTGVFAFYIAINFRHQCSVPYLSLPTRLAVYYLPIILLVAGSALLMARPAWIGTSLLAIIAVYVAGMRTARRRVIADQAKSIAEKEHVDFPTARRKAISYMHALAALHHKPPFRWIMK